eukprot:TRINITY_DN47016_c0_g1_i1.p1 TRINITY_DN47016_c0_g1~~TRINITY_DN47016_c0_g1_i1.p1  ORF type:complete len:644 (+),score=147.86 TRINITY_DN47016_c0_g1_i1:71-2002(+)
MEVCLDLVNGDASSSDTFVSLRIGDVHKQTRLVGSRTYRFPEACCRESFGTIEVYKRVGLALVQFDGGCNEILDVDVGVSGSVHCSQRAPDPGWSWRMDVSRQPSEARTNSRSSAAKEARAVRRRQRAEETKRYLAEHGLEADLAEAVQTILREKPSDPFAFLSNSLLQLSRGGEAALSLPRGTSEEQPQANEDVVLSMKVEGLSYEQLVADPVLSANFESTVKARIASAAGDDVTPEMVELSLSAGSVIVEARVLAPPTRSGGVRSVASALQDVATTAAFAETVVEGVRQLPGIEKAAVGVIGVRGLAVIAVPKAPLAEPLSMPATAPLEDTAEVPVPSSAGCVAPRSVGTHETLAPTSMPIAERDEGPVTHVSLAEDVHVAAAEERLAADVSEVPVDIQQMEPAPAQAPPSEAVPELAQVDAVPTEVSVDAASAAEPAPSPAPEALLSPAAELVQVLPSEAPAVQMLVVDADPAQATEASSDVPADSADAPPATTDASPRGVEVKTTAAIKPELTESSPPRLRVAIIRSQALRNADFFGASDPYCILEINGEEHKTFRTKVIDDNLNPIWNESYVFDYTPGTDLHFRVFDQDIIKSDDFLGDLVLPSRAFWPQGFNGGLELRHAGKKDGIPAMLFLEIEPC